MEALGVHEPHDGSLRALSSASWHALHGPMVHPAELRVGWGLERGIILGAFQRVGDAPPGAPVARRATGGAAVGVGEGTLHVVLGLSSPSALMPCDEDKILNRHVRPLLRALTRSGALAHYFGRDWLSVGHRPVAYVAFAHLRATGRTVVEAFVAVSTPFAIEERASYMGKAPGTLDELRGAKMDRAKLERAVRAAFGDTLTPIAGPLSIAPVDPPAEPPWEATVDEAIGPLRAGRDAKGAVRLGGELMASADAVEELETRLHDAPRQDLDALVEGVFGAPRTALFGVKNLRSIRDVLAKVLK
jgi:lipoate-protein ligase A